MGISRLITIVLIFEIAVGESRVDTYILQYLICLFAASQTSGGLNFCWRKIFPETVQLNQALDKDLALALQNLDVAADEFIALVKYVQLGVFLEFAGTNIPIWIYPAFWSFALRESANLIGLVASVAWVATVALRQ